MHDFADHIVCDAASKSEIVVPLIVGGQLLGVLDVDSPSASRFTETDQQGIEGLCNTFTAALEKSELRLPEFI